MSLQIRFDSGWKRPADLPPIDTYIQVAIRASALRAIIVSGCPNFVRDGCSTYYYHNGKKEGEEGYAEFRPTFKLLSDDQVVALGRVCAELAKVIAPLYPQLPHADYSDTDRSLIEHHAKAALVVLNRRWMVQPTVIQAVVADIVDPETNEIDVDKVRSWVTPQPKSSSKTIPLLALLVVTVGLGIYFRAKLADLASQMKAKVWAVK